MFTEKAKHGLDEVVVAERKRKIGLYGGTFDPVHNGHLAVARSALEQCRLDEILFIPAPFPPHKQKQLTGFQHRVAMLEIALTGEKMMSISLLEVERTSPSYTIDTLVELRKRIGIHHYFLIIGADSFVEVHLWYHYQQITKFTDFIIAARPGIEYQNIADQVKRLGRFEHDEDNRNVWVRDDGFRIYYLSSVHVALSSSDIRSMLKTKRTNEKLLPHNVFKYIQDHKLYSDFS